jgi:hypothetical protein
MGEKGMGGEGRGGEWRGERRGGEKKGGEGRGKEGGQARTRNLSRPTIGGSIPPHNFRDTPPPYQTPYRGVFRPPMLMSC